MKTVKYNPLNEKLKKQYEEVLLHGKCMSKKTVNKVWNDINIYEGFTGAKSFTTINHGQIIDYKKWLHKLTNSKGELLSLSTLRSRLASMRCFIEWLSIHPELKKKINGTLAGYLHLSKNDENKARTRNKKPVATPEELAKVLSSMPYETDLERRNRSIIAFLTVTGSRIDALASLKLKSINLNDLTVWQDPREVNTKFAKDITTTFIDFVPEAIKIMVDWVEYCRNELKLDGEAPLFSATSNINNPETFKFEAGGLSNNHWKSHQPIREIVKNAFLNAELKYHNPHSFRKTIVNWIMENCTQMEAKAISLSIGHDSIATTYNSYGYIDENKQNKVIRGIGKRNIELSKIPDKEFQAEMIRRMEK